MIVENRPGLSAIAYRTATHADLVRSIRRDLSSATRPGLGGLTTRDADDFSIALLDACAIVADVLTFYQERIANESYLRTATERRSILELARLIGYELRSGVAASAHLAFTLDESPGAPRQTTIEAGLKVQSIPGPGQTPQTFETIEAIDARVEWNAKRPVRTKPSQLAADASDVWLKGTALNLSRDDRIFIAEKIEAGFDRRLRRITSVAVDVAGGRTKVFLDPSSSSFKPIPYSIATGIWAMRIKAAPFGHNAPKETKINGGTVSVGEWTLDKQDRITDPDNPPPLTLDGIYQIEAGSWAVIEDSGNQELFAVTHVQNVSRAAYGIAGRVTQIALTDQWLGTKDSEPLLDVLRRKTIFVQSEELALDDTLECAVEGHAIELDGGADGITKGRALALADGNYQEIATVSGVTPDNSTILLETDLHYSYDRRSLVINANVALATHGETVHEVLGSGDGGQEHQEFTLRQAPLTYTSAPTATGAASTLEVRVNDLLWHEVPTLYGRESGERVFVTRADDEGRTTIRFGGRLPTGQENVTATYRKGTGSGGLVAAGQLSMLMTRPLGLKSVTNPAAAAGAGDPAGIDDSRRQAPLTVLTLDRVVSLRDYEDFARAYAGVAKAHATWTHDAAGRTVFLTVAGPNGADIAPGSETEKNLLAAVRAAGDPHVRVRAGICVKTSFKLNGRVWIDRDACADVVATAVERSLRTRFSFAAREFGQPVALSEVMAAIHDTPAVMAADIDTFYKAGQEIKLNDRLQAAVSGPDEGAMTSAELLTLDPGPIDLKWEPLP